MNVLVAAPHPDDDVIGCGGSLIKLTRAGHRIIIVYLTSGEAGSIDHTKEELLLIREREARQAARIMGVSDLVFLRNPDGYLTYGKENLVSIIRIIRENRPALIYMPHKNDAHKDHSVTSELFAEAIRRAAGPWFQECEGHPWPTERILCYEVWTPLRDVSYAEDITAYLPLKMKALRSHASQLRSIRYDDAAKSLNRYRGIMTGKGRYCECFRALSVSNI